MLGGGGGRRRLHNRSLDFGDDSGSDFADDALRQADYDLDGGAGEEYDHVSRLSSSTVAGAGAAGTFVKQDSNQSYHSATALPGGVTGDAWSSSAAAGAHGDNLDAMSASSSSYNYYVTGAGVGGSGRFAGVHEVRANREALLSLQAEVAALRASAEQREQQLQAAADERHAELLHALSECQRENALQGKKCADLSKKVGRLEEKLADVAELVDLHSDKFILVNETMQKRAEEGAAAGAGADMLARAKQNKRLWAALSYALAGLSVLIVFISRACSMGYRGTLVAGYALLGKPVPARLTGGGGQQGAGGGASAPMTFSLDDDGDELSTEDAFPKPVAVAAADSTSARAAVGAAAGTGGSHEHAE